MDICFGQVSDESATRTIREQSTPSRISGGRYSRPLAVVTLVLPHPLPQRLRRAAELRRDRNDRGVLRLVRGLLFEHEPHRALANLGGIFASPSHVSILSTFGASGKSGPIHPAGCALFTQGAFQESSGGGNFDSY